MKHILTASILALTVLSQGCVIVDDGPSDSSLTIVNDSSYVLYEINVSPVDSSFWGPDLLGSTVLYPNEAITVELDCDYYDVRVIDEYGVECVLYDLDLCFEDASWYVTNFDLDSCAFGLTATELTEKQSLATEPRAEVDSAL